MQLYEKRGATLLIRGDLQFTKAMHLKSDLLLHPVIQKGLFVFLHQVKRHGRYMSDCTYTNYHHNSLPWVA